MITLREAMRLVQAREGELFYLRAIGSKLYEKKKKNIRDMREQLDWEKIKVHHIDVRFDFEGDYKGLELEVSELSTKRRKMNG